MSTQRLFVYGTLGPGRPNEHVLAPYGGTWRRGSVRGALREEGWGAAMGFPGLVIGEPRADADPGVRVAGWVLTADLRDAWAKLDAFEGQEYRRVETTVTLEDGGRVTAWVYALR